MDLALPTSQISLVLGANARLPASGQRRPPQVLPHRQHFKLSEPLSPSRRQINRNPSCLISWAHCEPDGSACPSVGRHGSTKPSGRRAGEGERQSMDVSTVLKGTRISQAVRGFRYPGCTNVLALMRWSVGDE
jgi:hypothetical protein